MKQILQSLKTGQTILEEIPCPKVSPHALLIETQKSLVSAGTERMLLAFGKANFIGKIRQQPDKVNQLKDKLKTDGFIATLNAVRSKLDQKIPLGYCNVGKIIEFGDQVTGFKIGDRVVSNGYHAEIVHVSKNLCAKIPDNVTNHAASFTVLGAIALQGIRLSQPTLGECYVVIGLGLIGLLTVQLLRANGCRVLGADYDEKKCDLAALFGAQVVYLSRGEDFISAGKQFSHDKGIDAVIIAASTQSNDPLHQAATLCRKRGRIILVGIIGKEFSRADFYEKELSFQVSCSYGPGRYDEQYEKKGFDYPIGFIRWTEQRNFEAILEMMSQGSINVEPLITHEFDIDNAIKAYEILENDGSALGIILNYPESELTFKTSRKSEVIQQENFIKKRQAQSDNQKISLALIGSGNYGANILVPAFKKAGVLMHSVVSGQGISSKDVAKKYGFRYALSDDQLVWLDNQINTVVIATRHNQHATQVIQALKSGKHVFVEKPLCITHQELRDIENTYNHHPESLLMVGFNRRFAPQIQTIKSLLSSEFSSKSFIMTINAGSVPASHWIQDSQVGGGRIIGEACHFIDLLRYLSGHAITHWQATSLDNAVHTISDNVIITLTFADGSCGVIQYLSNGHQSFPKERLEIFCNGKILQLDNFRKLVGFGWKTFRKQNLRKQDKGQQACAMSFVNAIKNGECSSISFDELAEVSRLAIEISNWVRKEKAATNSGFCNEGK